MLDTGFLDAEDSDRHVSLAIGAIAVLAGPMTDFDSLAARLARHAAPAVDELASGIQRAITRLTAVSAGDWRCTPALIQGG